MSEKTAQHCVLSDGYEATVGTLVTSAGDEVPSNFWAHYLIRGVIVDFYDVYDANNPTVTVRFDEVIEPGKAFVGDSYMCKVKHLSSYWEEEQEELQQPSQDEIFTFLSATK